MTFAAAPLAVILGRRQEIEDELAALDHALSERAAEFYAKSSGRERFHWPQLSHVTAEHVHFTTETRYGDVDIAVALDWAGWEELR